MMKCPSFERLIDYIDGKLGQQVEAAPVGAHLAAGCPRCSADSQWYQKLRAITRGDDSIEPPAWVIKRAIRIFETQRAGPRVVERLGRAVAALIFDSFAQPAIAGVRSTETASRQLLYQAGDYSIDLQVAIASEHNASVIAQILRENQPRFESVAGLSIELVRGGRPTAATATNEMGEFTINDVVPGTYDLRVKTPDGMITVPELPVDAFSGLVHRDTPSD
jgi:hypothetical protein